MTTYDAAAHREILQKRETAMAESLAGVNSRVPQHIHQGLLFYFVHHVEPGSFLSAVLQNDLREACARADDVNRYALFDIVSWLYNHAPAGSWGSPEAFREWLNPTVDLTQPWHILKTFPRHWGEAPRFQSQDMVVLPDGYGTGSSTMASWIQEKLDQDNENPDLDIDDHNPDIPPL